jgi:hypothetical protein
MNIASSMFTGSPGGGSGIINLNTILSNIQQWFLRYPLGDVGVGSFDGGFGLVFWGIGFPSWIYIAIYSLFHFKTNELPKYLVLAYLPIGFLLLLIVPKNNIEFASRFSIFVVAIGLFAMCLAKNMLRDNFVNKTVKIFCIMLSIMTVSLMSISTMPTYNLRSVLSDRFNRKYPSEYKYLADSVPEYAEFRYIWEPFDFMTRNDTIGLRCLVVANSNYCISAPAFGSNLQNRVMNFKPGNHEQVDAYLYLYADRTSRVLSNRLIPENIRVSENATMHDVLKDSNYTIVSHSSNGCLLLRKSILNHIDKKIMLQSYYRDTWSEDINIARRILPKMIENVPVIASSYIGYGIKYLDYASNRIDRVIVTLEGMENITAKNIGVLQCYTFEKPLDGYDSDIISTIHYKNKSIKLYLNKYHGTKRKTSV